jgi:hypothetical protein
VIKKLVLAEFPADSIAARNIPALEAEAYITGSVNEDPVRRKALHKKLQV